MTRVAVLKGGRSLERQVSQARTELMDAAIAALGKERGDAADATRAEYRAARELARDEDHPQEQTEHDRLRTIAIHSVAAFAIPILA